MQVLEDALTSLALPVSCSTEVLVGRGKRLGRLENFVWTAHLERGCSGLCSRPTMTVCRL